eukprot:COSAG02_NODE_419_length_22613_cov_22.994492_29_plen_135_part_00
MGEEEPEETTVLDVQMVKQVTAADREAEARQAAVTIEDEDEDEGGQDEDDAAGAEADGEEEEVSDAEPAAEPAAEAALPEADDVVSECVKVAVRVRPLSAKEIAEGSSQCVSFPEAGQIVIVSAHPRAVSHTYG